MKIHHEGMPFIITGAILSILIYIFSTALGFLGLALTGFMAYFFRDPERVAPNLNKGETILSPADGMVVDICEDDSMGIEGYVRVSIFLNVFDVHVNRIPYSGKITQKHYKKGSFAHAGTEKAQQNNESLTLKIEGECVVFVRQVAGLIARRIVCYSEDGDSVKAGQRYGIIKFGSRVDLYFPRTFEIFIKKGQTMVGGETIIARS